MRGILPWQRMLVTIGACSIIVAPSLTSSAQSVSVPDGLYTDMQAMRGAALYAEHCAACHGGELGGTDYGPGLTGAELRSRWRHRTLGELFTLMRDTMPLNSPGGLSVQQNADLLAFLLQRADVSPGTTDLTGRVDALSGFGLGAEGSGR